MTLDLVTICAKNYRPYVQVLAASVRRHLPDARLFVLIVDAAPGEVSFDGTVEVLTPGDLNLEADEFDRMAMMYTIRELCTAVKPWGLRRVLELSPGLVAYLDPDIELFADLAPVEAALSLAPIVLTPHRRTPVPPDGMLPAEEAFLLGGAYNLGFVAVTDGAHPFLNWWKTRLARFAIDAPHAGYFTDQRWIDLAPSYFGVTILKDPAVNVAYWNLDERVLERSANKWLVDGQPLRFFHFSGFRPNRPWEVSRYTAPNPRVRRSDNPALGQLLDSYEHKLLAAGAPPHGPLAPAGFTTLRDGTTVTQAMRNAFREALLLADRRGEPLPISPFSETLPGAPAWGGAPISRYSPITNGLLAVWRTRPDLQELVPDPYHPQSAFLEHWAQEWGVAEGSVPPEWVPAATDHPPAEPELNSSPGCNLWAYYRAELGVGELGRIISQSVEASGIQHSKRLLKATRNRQNIPFTADPSPVDYDIDLVVANADQMSLWRASARGYHQRRRRTIGVWSWELEDFPKIMHRGFDLVDEVWAISTFVQKAVAAHTNKPVHVVPIECHIDPRAVPALDRATFGVPADLPYFLFMFDYNSDFARKNPLAVVEAFRRAFGSRQDVRLVIKSSNGDLHWKRHEQLLLAGERDHRVVLINDYIEHAQRLALINECLAYVSLHRSEGFGLTMMEAMSLGKPVVATGYSGNLDFMTHEDSFLVPHRLIGVDNSDYYRGGDWADPDLDHAAEALREIESRPGTAERIGDAARRRITMRAREAHAARFIRERVKPEACGQDTIGASFVKRLVRPVRGSRRKAGRG